MSNILRVTTPLTGYDSPLQQRTDTANKAPDPRIQGPVVPNQIGRASCRERV